MPFVTAKDGVRIFYELHDYTDPWAKRPFMILQHGFNRSSKYWYQWAPILARYYKVVCPDLRGLGRSTEGFNAVNGLSAEHYLSDLVSIIESLDVDSVHYAGESLGGMLGIALTASYPERVRTLSLLSAPLAIGPETVKKHAVGYPSWEHALRELGSVGWSKAMNTATRFPPDTDPGFLDWFNAEASDNPVDTLVAMARLAPTIDLAPFLEKVRVPALGIYPSEGPATADAVQTFKRKIANFQLISIPGKYHMVYFLKPTVCARHVLYFMANHDGIACDE